MMNKTVLMLSVSCMSFIAGADLCYAGFNPYDTPPALSAVMLNSRNSTHTSHLTAAHLSSLEDFDKDDNTPLIQLAAACFVTDTTDCSGNEFAGNNADDDSGGVPPGGGDDYELDDGKRCIEEGYTKTSCPEGYEAVNFCPYDSRYFEYCRALCPSDYVTCEPPYHGAGEACGDKYASCECTPCSSGYDYTTIPEGYVQDGEACLDCDGKTKYKIKSNPCDGFMDCGSMGPEAGANTCQSGTEIKYDNCKPCANECSMDSCPAPYTCKKEECSNKYCKNGCQSGYVWNASSQTCTCDPNKYKYTCTGANETGGSGSSCDGKYQSCRCASGYVWENGQCVCGASFKYTCTGANESPNGTSCGGKYEACSCTNDYQWIDYSCKSGEWKRCNGYRCRVGEIVYSDGTCSSKKVSGKIPIAVVIFSEYYSCNIAMALKPIGSYQWRTVMGFELEEEEQEIIVSQYYDCIYADDTFGDKNEYPAFLAADEYKTEGTEPGDWGLPEAGLMNYISNHISAINNGFNLAGGTPIETNSKYWSASAYSENETWGSSFTGSFSIHHYDKDEFLEVRPVIEF